jgi:adenosine deaminase CECR1
LGVCCLGLLGLIPAWAGDFSPRFEEIKAAGSPGLLYRFLYAMPKAGDLHHHAGGCWRMEDLFAVAVDPQRNGGNRFYTRVRAGCCPGEPGSWRRFQTLGAFAWKDLPEPARAEYLPLDELTPVQRMEFINSLRLDAPGEGRQEFFEEIWPRLGALGRSVDVFLEMTVATMKRYGAEGVRYLEPQTIPAGMMDAQGAVVDPEVFHSRLKARLAQPDAVATGVAVRWQVVVLRFTPVAERMIEEAYAFVSQHRDLWVGVNMAGREDNDKGHPRRFLSTYRRMRQRHSGIGLAIHAGEVDEANPHIRDTLLLGATRIGHGNNLLTDEDLLLQLRGGLALVEINLVSNLLLEYVDRYADHHFPELLRTGVPVALSTDDSGMWDSNMTDEYMTAVGEFNLTWDELVACGRNSLQWCFAEPALKARLLGEYDRDVAAFEKGFSTADWKARLESVPAVAYGFARRRWGLEFATGQPVPPGPNSRPQRP